MTVDETLCDIARNNALTFTEEEQDAMAEAILEIQELTTALRDCRNALCNLCKNYFGNPRGCGECRWRDE